MRSPRLLSLLLTTAVAVGALAGSARADALTLMITGDDAKQPVVEAALVPWLAKHGFEAQIAPDNDPVFTALIGCQVLNDQDCNQVVKASTLFVNVDLKRDNQRQVDKVTLTGWLYGPTGAFVISSTEPCDPCTNELLGPRAEKMAAALFAKRDEGEAPLQITSTPAGARVLIDGDYKGETPLTIQVPTGARTVTIELAGRKTETRRVDAKKDEPQTVAVTLASSGGPTDPTKRNPLFLGVAGVGVAAIIGGVVLFAIDEDESAPMELPSTYFDSAPGGIALAGAGVVAAAVGTFLYLNSGGKAPSRTPTAWLAPGHGGGVGLAGTF